jgi:rhamnogalacturonan acetylesterase
MSPARLIFTQLVLVVALRGAESTTPSAAPATAAPAEPIQHPALFLVGDSITKTGTGNGERGPWGMGYELIPLFDPAKIHVYNEGAGGRSSRGYIEEGLWAKITAQLQAGDFVLVMFGHNDTANSANYPDRTTITGSGDQTVQIGVGEKRKTLHTYGWYLEQYVKETKAKGATIVICSPVPRNGWSEGKIKRGFDGYAQWAGDAAKASGAFFIDLNTLAADRYDALGQAKATTYFNDFQHTKKSGARINAECVAAGLRQLRECTLAGYLAAPSATAAGAGP